MKIEGSRALVTGGGTGIGRAVALQLAGSGAAGVAINYSRSHEEAESTAAELRALGTTVAVIQADVSSDQDARRLVAESVASLGGLSCVVNSAGVTQVIPYGDLDAVTDEVWDRILGVNVKGTFQVSRAAAPALRESGGAIVNVGSMAGLLPTGSSLPYGVSKAALHQLTRALALALAPEVTVNAVAPGLVSTRWFRQHADDEFADGIETRIGRQTPLGRVATADDVARSVLGLLAGEMVTGQLLVVDGGKWLTY